MSEEKSSPIGIIVVVAVIAVVAAYFAGKSGGGNGDQTAGNQQQPTNGSDTNQTAPPPDPLKPEKPAEPKEPAFVKEGQLLYPTEVVRFDSSAADPMSILIKPNGDAVVTDHVRNDVRIFSASTKSTAKILLKYHGLKGLDMDGDGNIYVSSVSRDKVLKISPSGVYKVVREGIRHASDVAVDSKGNVWVASSVLEKIFRFSSDGTERVWSSVKTGHLAKAKDGSIYFASLPAISQMS